MARGEGTGETTVAVSQASAFAYLADPRNAAEWFAGVALEGAPSDPLREGMTWRFVQHLRRDRVVPVRMQAYTVPSRFVWRTQRRWPFTNLAWELRCELAAPSGGSPEETSVKITNNATQLSFTIRIEPGPLGWASLMLGAWLAPHSLGQRAQRAVDRAGELLLAREEVLRGGQGQHGRQGHSRHRHPPSRKPSGGRSRPR